MILTVGWQAPTRDPVTGRLLAHPERFPSGIKALADKIHSKGLKLGIYSDSGVWTCQRRPGSGGYELLDAQTFSDWGIDYLKLDNCFTNVLGSAEARYQKMSTALATVKREIFFSLCNWGQEKPWEWGPYIGDAWRVTGDIGDLWEAKTARDWWNCPCTTLSCSKVVLSGGHGCSVMNILNKIAQVTSATSELGFSDPDMLEVGNGGMTFEEYKSHFSLWAALRSPLLIGTDLVASSAETLQILSNKHVISVNQDPLKVSISRATNERDHQIWMGPVSDALKVVIVLNTLNQARNISLTIEDFGLKLDDPNTQYELFDLWTEQRMIVGKSFTSTLAAHGVWMVKVYQQSR